MIKGLVIFPTLFVQDRPPYDILETIKQRTEDQHLQAKCWCSMFYRVGEYGIDQANEPHSGEDQHMFYYSSHDVRQYLDRLSSSLDYYTDHSRRFHHYPRWLV